ncbi:MAG: hypothetical protein ABIA47_02950 [bacterium]
MDQQNISFFGGMIQVLEQAGLGMEGLERLPDEEPGDNEPKAAWRLAGDVLVYFMVTSFEAGAKYAVVELETEPGSVPIIVSRFQQGSMVEWGAINTDSQDNFYQEGIPELVRRYLQEIAARFLA